MLVVNYFSRDAVWFVDLEGTFHVKYYNSNIDIFYVY